MKKKKSQGDMPAGELKQVKDFLPPPQELFVPEETVKVTLALKKSSVDFFKEHARKHGAKYQKVIRDLLDRYAGHYAH